MKNRLTADTVDRLRRTRELAADSLEKLRAMEPFLDLLPIEEQAELRANRAECQLAIQLITPALLENADPFELERVTLLLSQDPAPEDLPRH